MTAPTTLKFVRYLIDGAVLHFFGTLGTISRTTVLEEYGIRLGYIFSISSAAKSTSCSIEFGLLAVKDILHILGLL